MSRLKYSPEMLEKVNNMDGGTIQEICAILHINNDTFYEWKKKYTEFKDSVDLLMDRRTTMLYKVMLTDFKEGRKTPSFSFGMLKPVKIYQEMSKKIKDSTSYTESLGFVGTAVERKNLSLAEAAFWTDLIGYKFGARNLKPLECRLDEIQEELDKRKTESFSFED